ncbi:hypothetical protein HYPBUDRAFT_230214 [Hyphopichia burtonii NRRL Y-1933]|uniref:Uncharacterized protein n=1 Tax=Hyphopichia burtonii NRRL Y-1933 TaxID=984485 RepID=A0A1E4RCZ1_9ASCO|nr:hypothetical protein HYPBUDRAFT_230214 [Hyphopichia burtonii NRRL Y-1933]ODV65120.1 hypothetical protein HYPBUDRAFT_230214 [Hyphopichia burtonii NRRL Y-1933]
MGYNQGLAVGLGIGVTVIVVFAICIVIWYRNQRQQRREDNIENDIDLDLRDNQSFSQFQEELHKPYNDPNKSSTTQSGDLVNNEKLVQDHNSINSTKSDKDIIQPPPQLNHNRNYSSTSTDFNSRHNKTGSSYDFYESFIPILPERNNNNNNNNNDIDESIIQPPPPINDTIESNPTSNNSSNTSIIGNPNTKSLDNLAKQLTGPTFFEKLPSRAATINVKQRNPTNLPNNSSGDLIQNQLIDTNDAINDNYVYESNSPRKRDTKISVLSNNEEPVPSHPYRTIHASSPFEDKNKI